MEINLGLPLNLFAKDTHRLKQRYACKIFTFPEKSLQPEIFGLLNTSSDLTIHFWFDLE